MLRGQIEQYKYNKLLVGQAIPNSNTSIIIKLIRNSDIKIYDISRAEQIYETTTPLLQVNIISQNLPHVKIECVPLALTIAENHKNIQLYMNFPI